MAEQAKAAAPRPDHDFRRVYEAGVGYVWESLRRLGKAPGIHDRLQGAPLIEVGAGGFCG